MYKYFKGCIKPEQVKSMFRDLAMKFHPDIAGQESTRSMQEIIDEYHKILKSFTGFKFHGKDNKEYEYKYTYQFEQSLVDKVNSVFALKLANIVLEVVGNWVWVSGTSRDQADLFNANGLKFRWSRKHNKWYWSRSMSFAKTKASGLSYDSIKATYGGTEINNNDVYAQVS